MKRLRNGAATLLLLICILSTNVLAVRQLIPVGEVIGMELKDDQVCVAAIDEKLGENARKAGLQAGDRILRVNSEEIRSAQDVQDALTRADGTVELTIERSGKEKSLEIAPQITRSGPRLGVYLREGTSGVGTVTWYDPETGAFGALGHGVNDRKGHLLQMTEGTACKAAILSIHKGQCGTPGQLMGALKQGDFVGKLTKNTTQGVFGETQTGWQGTCVPVGTAEQVHTGSAVIRATVMGTQPQEYSVEILKIYPGSREEGRNMLLKVTDSNLLATTGGIVQGMGVSYNRDNQVNP